MPDIVEYPEMVFWPESRHLSGKSNWKGWKRRITLVCEMRDLLGHLEGSTKEPTRQDSTTSTSAEEEASAALKFSENEAAVEAWERNERWLRFLLVWNMTYRASARISVEGIPAADIWFQLYIEYDDI